LSATWTYRLTPHTTMTATATGLRTEEFDFNLQSINTRQNLFGVSLSTRLSPTATASIGIRRSDYDSPLPTRSYRENAVVGALQFRL
jgi:uncharacterized protein (PEP-CTERM system associated)